MYRYLEINALNARKSLTIFYHILFSSNQIVLYYYPILIHSLLNCGRLEPKKFLSAKKKRIFFKTIRYRPQTTTTTSINNSIYNFGVYPVFHFQPVRNSLLAFKLIQPSANTPFFPALYSVRNLPLSEPAELVVATENRQSLFGQSLQ